MQLLVEGRSITVLQMGRDFLVIKGSFDLPASNATLRLRIDESERSWTVHLPEGISSKSNRVTIGAQIDAAIAF